MRTIVTNDLETRIRTTETIKLTSKGVSSEVYTSMIGENEANELAGISTGPDISNAITDPRTLIRTNGDVIYEDVNGIIMTRPQKDLLYMTFQQILEIRTLNWNAMLQCLKINPYSLTYRLDYI